MYKKAKRAYPTPVAVVSQVSHHQRLHSTSHRFLGLGCYREKYSEVLEARNATKHHTKHRQAPPLGLHGHSLCPPKSSQHLAPQSLCYLKKLPLCSNVFYISMDVPKKYFANEMSAVTSLHCFCHIAPMILGQQSPAGVSY